MIRPFVMLALALTIGCGSGAIQLTHEEYEGLPHDYRLEIFDAENDLTIARNRQDEASNRKANAERALIDLEQRWKGTSHGLTASGQAAKIPKARKVFEMNAAYVASQVDVAAAGILRAEAETRLSRARLELVGQRQLARIGRATVGSIKPLEEKVAELEIKLKEASAAEIDLRTRVQKQLNAWKVAEDEFASGSGDYDTGVWGQ